MLRAFALLLITLAAVAASDHTGIGARRCQDCHSGVFERNTRTVHWVSFTDFARSDNEVARNLAITDPVAEGQRCRDCHGHGFQSAGGDKVARIEPVSCESCHGQASSWLETHYLKFDPAKNENLSTFLAERRDMSVKAGMRPSWSLSGSYRACFGCHVGTDEDIVNRGGHLVMKRFELLAYSIGTIRHWHGHDLQPPSVSRQAAVHLTGQVLQLEATVSALARSTQPGRFRTDHLALAQKVRRRLDEIWVICEGGCAELEPILNITAAIWSSQRASEGRLLTAQQVDEDGSGAWTRRFAAMQTDLAQPIAALLAKLDGVPINPAMAAKLIPASMPER